MGSPTPVTPQWNWQRIALKWFAGGIGFAVCTAVIVGMIAWRASRPEPPTPWNKTALMPRGPARFSATSDSKRISFWYSLENTTNKDYEVTSNYLIKVCLRGNDGAISQPLPTEDLPSSIFIPAKEKGMFTFSVRLTGIPERKLNEPEETYHDRLGGYVDGQFSRVSGFVLFDDVAHYEVDLPRWLPHADMTSHKQQ